jgi:hypothetical protein
MTITDGKYTVLFNDGEEMEKIGTFEVAGNQMTMIEDPRGMLAKILPEGDMSAAHKYRIISLMRSGYYSVVPADEVVEE